MGIDLERGRKNACLYPWSKETAMCVVCSPGAVLGFAAQTSRASFVLALSSICASLSVGTLQGLDEVESGYCRQDLDVLGSGSLAKHYLLS